MTECYSLQNCHIDKDTSSASFSGQLPLNILGHTYQLCSCRNVVCSMVICWPSIPNILEITSLLFLDLNEIFILHMSPVNLPNFLQILFAIFNNLRVLLQTYTFSLASTDCVLPLRLPRFFKLPLITIIIIYLYVLTKYRFILHATLCYV